jgi:transcriptional regulator with XRE-family HTH domain
VPAADKKKEGIKRVENKLGEFIRLHRERTTPSEVGLPAGGLGPGRRRTPGLRREELAQLCAVSPTWLTWLEQGRPVSASAKVLARLAEVMHLTGAERAYLFRLADKLDPALPGDADGGGSPSAAQLRAIVDAIASPAYMLNREWNAVAWNEAASQLFTGWLDLPRTAALPPQQPNLLSFMFLEPAARKLIADWPERARRLVAEFRADCGKHADQEPFASLIAELVRGSEDFSRLWNAQQVVGRDGGTRRFTPQGPARQDLEMSFEQVTFNAASGRGLKLVMLLPAR